MSSIPNEIGSQFDATRSNALQWYIELGAKAAKGHYYHWNGSEWVDCTDDHPKSQYRD